jgi:hypothetical protein
MGKYNSSIYRVRPLMKIVEADYQAFLKLLSLVGIDALSTPGVFRYDGENCTEMQLKPTKTHLKSLIDYLAEKTPFKGSIKGQDRKNLLYGTLTERKQACQKAKAELENNYDKLTAADRPWYMFEGFTNPDIFIEGEDYVIVCEGKWTEPHITTTTTYLSSKSEYRNQMIRHIQGALNYTNKKVYAFYIVDANCGYTNELTKESFCNQLNLETIPLGEIEKIAIAESYFGYATWQDIKTILPNVIFKEKSEI